MSLLGLLLIGLTVLCCLTPAFCESWEEFRNNHIDTDGHYKEEDYCTIAINNGHIRGEKGWCKPTNTFIHEDAYAVKAVCDKHKKEQRVTSTRSFRYTVCHLMGDRMAVKCVYKAVDTNRKKPIVVICKDEAPVHLEGVEYH